jgi:hypothetical protein
MRALVSLVLSIAAVGSAFAQAGSTGGTLGNTDKSISGDREEPRRAPPHAKTSTPTSCKLAMVWANQINGFGSSVWTISADGTAVESGLGNGHGHAVMSGHSLTINYTTTLDQGIYAMTLNRDCTGATGKVTSISGLTTLPGRTAAATFTAAGPAN